MTPRQLEVLRYVEEYRGQNGCAPTLQEIAHQLRISKVTVFNHLRNLEKAKQIRRGYYRRRGIEVAHSNRKLPLAGRITAGKPIESLASQPEIDLLAPLRAGRDLFVLEVAGDAWVDQQIRAGDLLICAHRKRVREGELAVLNVQGGASLQRVGPDVSSDSLQGIVVGVYRRL